MLNKTTFWLFFLLIGCNSENCLSLPESFNSYEQTIELIEHSKFQIHDELTQINSSWIDKVEFFSCNKEDGFLIVSVNGKKYFHQNVPISVWENFRIAASKGSFYNGVIKNRYALSIKPEREKINQQVNEKNTFPTGEIDFKNE